MTAPRPVHMQWLGDSFVPAGKYWQRLADQLFVVGMVYPLEVREDRSMRSHQHYFACINEAFNNLPEHIAARVPSPDHLRKMALIKAGYCDEKTFSCVGPEEAERLAAFIRPMDGYAIVVVRDDTVTVFTAKSQSMRAMNKVEFAESKERVLGILADLIGTTRKALTNAGDGA